jgi:hypothetical protein
MVALLCFAGVTTQSKDLSTQAAPPGTYGRLPLAFEANHGQVDGEVEFLAHGSGYQLFLTRGEAVLALMSPAAEPGTSAAVPTKMREARPVSDVKQAVVRITLDGAKPDPLGVGLEPLPGKVNYLRGNDRGNWQTNIPTYAKVSYESVYPGIDLVYYGNAERLEYDFIVAPGADPDDITVRFEGTDLVELKLEGDLVLSTSSGSVRFEKPVVYQERDGRRELLEGGYIRKGPHQIGFQVQAYDPARPLIIDPVLSYSTYLGAGSRFGNDVAVDVTGAAYVTGIGWNGDAFVAKLTPDGTRLEYVTYVGGSGVDEAIGIAVDTIGAAYIAGTPHQLIFPSCNLCKRHLPMWRMPS